MTLNFPNAPTNGQVYAGYQYSTAKGVWARTSFSALEASTTNLGLVQLATSAETLAGTAVARAVTPAALSAFLPGTTGIGLGKAFTPGRGSLDAQGQLFQNNGQSVISQRDFGPITINANNMRETGVYTGFVFLNTPITNEIAVLNVETYSNDWVSQTFTVISGANHTWKRAYHSGTTWSPWSRVVRHDNSVHWGAKHSPMAFNSSYNTVWNGGRGGGVDINPYFSTTSIQILTTGQYEVEAFQRGTTSSDFIGIGLSGNRETLFNRLEGVWTHDHAAGASNFSTSKYIGLLNAGELITAGGNSAGGLLYGGASYLGMYTVKRLS
jgi:hypothetical protein